MRSLKNTEKNPGVSSLTGKLFLLALWAGTGLTSFIPAGLALEPPKNMCEIYRSDLRVRFPATYSDLIKSPEATKNCSNLQATEAFLAYKNAVGEYPVLPSEMQCFYDGTFAALGYCPERREKTPHTLVGSTMPTPREPTQQGSWRVVITSSKAGKPASQPASDTWRTKVTAEDPLYMPGSTTGSTTGRTAGRTVGNPAHTENQNFQTASAANWNTKTTVTRGD